MDNNIHRKGAYKTFLYTKSIYQSEIEIFLVTRDTCL